MVMVLEVLAVLRDTEAEDQPMEVLWGADIKQFLQWTEKILAATIELETVMMYKLSKTLCGLL